MLCATAHSVKQNLLHAGFRLQTLYHVLVDGLARDDVVQEHGAIVARLLLPGRADALDDLFVQLEVPPQAEEADDVRPVLKVQPVASRSRVSE